MELKKEERMSPLIVKLTTQDLKIWKVLDNCPVNFIKNDCVPSTFALLNLIHKNVAKTLAKELNVSERGLTWEQMSNLLFNQTTQEEIHNYQLKQFNLTDDLHLDNNTAMPIIFSRENGTNHAMVIGRFDGIIYLLDPQSHIEYTGVHIEEFIKQFQANYFYLIYKTHKRAHKRKLNVQLKKPRNESPKTKKRKIGSKTKTKSKSISI